MKRKKQDVWYRVRTTDYYDAYEEAILNSKECNAMSRFQLSSCDLGNVRLKLTTGQQVRTIWKDKSVTRETIEVLLGKGTTQFDMNNIPDHRHYISRRIYVVRNIHGTRVLIPLRGRLIQPYPNRAA